MKKYNNLFWKFCRIVSITEPARAKSGLKTFEISAEKKTDLNIVIDYLKDNNYTVLINDINNLRLEIVLP